MLLTIRNIRLVDLFYLMYFANKTPNHIMIFTMKHHCIKVRNLDNSETSILKNDKQKCMIDLTY